MWWISLPKNKSAASVTILFSFSVTTLLCRLCRFCMPRRLHPVRVVNSMPLFLSVAVTTQTKSAFSPVSVRWLKCYALHPSCTGTTLTVFHYPEHPRFSDTWDDSNGFHYPEHPRFSDTGDDSNGVPLSRAPQIFRHGTTLTVFHYPEHPRFSGEIQVRFAGTVIRLD